MNSAMKHGRDWKNTHCGLCRWRDKCIWEKLLEDFPAERKLKWRMLHAKYILTPWVQKAKIRKWAAQKGAQHQTAFCRGVGASDKPDLRQELQQIVFRQFSCWRHRNAVDGQRCHTNTILEYIKKRGRTGGIPPKPNRKVQRK